MAKFTGKGCEILVDTGTTTPTWTAVAQVQEIGDISVTAEEVDVTTLDAGDYRDYISGFKDPGECELTVIWDPELPSHGEDPNGLIGMFDSGDVHDWAIRWNSSAAGGAKYGMFSGFVRDKTHSAINADDPQTLTPLIRLTSPIVLADTLPVTFAAMNDIRKAATARRDELRKRGAERRAAIDAAAKALEAPKAA